MEWWPFTKNMSSRESILFVSDQLILNPLEVLAAVTIAAWLLQRLADPDVALPSWRDVLPAHRLHHVRRDRDPARQGDWWRHPGRRSSSSARSSTCRRLHPDHEPVDDPPSVPPADAGVDGRRLDPEHLRARLLPRACPAEEQEVLESLTEHSATVQMNALFVFARRAVAVEGARGRCGGRCSSLGRRRCSTRTCSRSGGRRWSRSSSALVDGHRRALLPPTAGVLVRGPAGRRRLGSGFVLATWNAQGGIGLPAQAVKIGVLPRPARRRTTAAPTSTARSRPSTSGSRSAPSPLTGLGFGQKFYTPIALPDISFFEFCELPPAQLDPVDLDQDRGSSGSSSMLFMFARAVQLGARSVLAGPHAGAGGDRRHRADVRRDVRRVRATSTSPGASAARSSSAFALRHLRRLRRGDRRRRPGRQRACTLGQLESVVR